MNQVVLKNLVKKLPKLLFGFMVCGLGLSLTIKAGVGMSSWSTFTAGLVNVTGIPFGKLTQIIGFAIIIITIPLKVYPGIGTILNMIFLGFFIDFFKDSGYIIQPENFTLQILMCLIGLVIFLIGCYIYISCGLGAGPRDGLMIAMIKITGKNVSIVKPSIEITVLIIGAILGSAIGVGTVLVAVLGGKILDIIFKFMKFDPKALEQQNLYELSKLLFA